MFKLFFFDNNALFYIKIKLYNVANIQNLFFNNIDDEVYEEENDNSFDKLEKISAKNNIKAIIIDVATFAKKKVSKLSKV